MVILVGDLSSGPDGGAPHARLRRPYACIGVHANRAGSNTQQHG